MAMIQEKQGLSAESISICKRAIALLDQLNRDQPGDQRCLADLGLADHYMAKTLMQKGDLEGALIYQSVAIDLRNKLVEASPKNPSNRIDLAQSLNNLSVLLMRSGRPVEAFDPSRRANAILRALLEEHPADPQLRQTLALSDGTLATLLGGMGRWQDSRAPYAESVEIMDGIVAENPAVTEFRRVLATCASTFGQYLIDHGETEAGLCALAKARAQAETVRRKNPDDVNNLNNLASVLRGIGKTHAIQGKTLEALDSLRQSIAISERIAAEAGAFTYDLACGFALFSEVIGRVSSTTAGSKDSSQRFADRAMQTLKQAVDRGYREVDWIERDPELRSLRSRADFQSLLKTLRQKR
jgi:tetratricopeptide (TPR) repeat protein